MSYSAGIPQGTTANRPDKGLVIGYRYLDTTLGFVIWWSGTDWIDATGNVV